MVKIVIVYSSTFVYMIFLKNVNLSRGTRPPGDQKSQIILFNVQCHAIRTHICEPFFVLTQFSINYLKV